MIHYSEMMKVLEARDGKGDLIPFSLSYVKADLKRRTGGDEKTIACATRIGANKDGTINIKLIPSGLIKKVHLRLITAINTLAVFY
jgi:hypothetical protein